MVEQQEEGMEVEVAQEPIEEARAQPAVQRASQVSRDHRVYEEPTQEEMESPFACATPGMITGQRNGGRSAGGGSSSAGGGSSSAGGGSSSAGGGSSSAGGGSSRARGGQLPRIVPEPVVTPWLEHELNDGQEYTGLPTFRAPRHRVLAQADVLLSNDPVSFLHILLTVEMLERFVDETNAYAVDSETQNWKQLTVMEFKLYIGIVLFMGVLRLATRRDYWYSTCRQELVYSRMQYARFCAITSALHYRNTAGWTDEERQQQKEADCFYVVTPFVTDLAKTCRQAYRPLQHLSIDEQCIPFKGRHTARQYNPMKPNKWHFKVTCVCRLL